MRFMDTSSDKLSSRHRGLCCCKSRAPKYLRLLRTRLCLKRHTINLGRLLCKGRDEIVLGLSPHRHAGFRAGKKPVSSKVHDAVTSRKTARFCPNFMFQLFSSIRQNLSHVEHSSKIHSSIIRRGQMIATRTRMRDRYVPVTPVYASNRLQPVKWSCHTSRSHLA